MTAKDYLNAPDTLDAILRGFCGADEENVVCDARRLRGAFAGR